MTSEKMLQRIQEIKNINASNDKNRDIEILCNDTILKLQDEIREAEAKKSGKLDSLKACKRILKTASKLNKPTLECTKIIDGCQYIMDGYRLVKLSKPLPLPKLPDGMNFPDVLKLLPTHKKDISLELPDLAELKTYIKLQKLEHKKEKGYTVFYDFGEDLPFVNAEFLADILEILPGATATVNKNQYDMLYFTDDNGDAALLCPVRPPENITRTKTNLK